MKSSSVWQPYVSIMHMVGHTKLLGGSMSTSMAGMGWSKWDGVCTKLTRPKPKEERRVECSELPTSMKMVDE